MILSAEINDKVYRFNASEPISIAIPLNFNGAQPNAYGVEKATSFPYQAGEIIGDTRQGGSCNFEQVKLIPHCNGTHTESVGHITHERISINDCLNEAFLPASLISVLPELAFSSRESYPIETSESDCFVSKRLLQKTLEKIDKNWLEALIIRTLPNAPIKCEQVYAEQIPAFFSTEAMEFIVESGVKHLLVDMPSIDRLFDEGKLSNHRIFWRVSQDSFEIESATRINSTVTELIYVPDQITDGNYFLNLQIAPFSSDASPSRPILFRPE